MTSLRHLILIRHGESELNALSRQRRTYCGQVETPLNPVGRQQARAAGQKVAALDYLELAAAVSSPLTRAVETLAIVQDELPAPLATLPPDPRLMERSHGLFEGLAEEVVHRDYPHYKDDPDYCHFMNHFEQAAPGGETLAIVMQRAWSAVLDLLSSTSGDALIVSHFNPIRCILGRALDLAPEETLRLHIPNADPIVLSFNGSFRLHESPPLVWPDH
jgi:probable phosphoglycerate mutase